MRLSTWLGWAVAIVGIPVVLTGCNNAQQDAPSVTQEVVRPAKLFTVEVGSTGQIRKFPATSLANQSVEMSFRLAGQLVDLKLVEGQLVQAGQPLARLDDRDANSQLRDAEANFDLAQANFERTKKLLARKLVADSDFDLTTAQLKTAEAALAHARNSVEYTRLEAPFSGVIARMYVKNHQYVQPRQPVLLLQSIDKVDVQIQISEDLFMTARRDGLPPEFRPVLTFPGHPDKQFVVQYKEHSSEIDPATRTYAVTFTLDAPKDIWLVPGMSGDLALDLDMVSGRHTQQFVVPLQAVIKRDSDGETVVWVYSEATQTASPVPVTLGAIRDAGVEVVRGLQGGERLVVAGLNSIHEGLKLKPLKWERGI